jgi:hypothetical protein
MLADVEIQLCLSWLDMRSRLLAARCCRHFLHCASQYLSWKGTPPFQINGAGLSRPAEEMLLQRSLSFIPRSLIRFAPVYLSLSYRSTSANSALPLLLEVKSFLRLHSLHIRCDLTLEHVGQLVTVLHQEIVRTSMRDLLIAGTQPVSIPLLSAVAQLPLLRTILLRVEQNAASLHHLTSFVSAPHVTELSLLGARSLRCERLEANAPCLSDFVSLHTLRLRHWHCSKTHSPFPHLLPLITSVAGSLKRLELQWVAPVWECNHPTMSLEDGFAVLEKLSELQLVVMNSFDVLLPAVAHAPHLQLLTLSMSDNHFIDRMLMGSLRTLLQNMPALSVRVVPRPRSWRLGEFSSQELRKEEAYLHQLQRIAPGRVQMGQEDELLEWSVGRVRPAHECQGDLPGET